MQLEIDSDELRAEAGGALPKNENDISLHTREIIYKNSGKIFVKYSYST